MTEKQQKIAKLCTVLSVILMIIAVVALIFNIVNLSVLKGRKASMEKYSQELQSRIDGGAEEIDYKKSKEFVEKYARDYLNMKYSDEVIYSPSDSSSETEAEK